MGFVVPRALFAVLLVGACGRTDLLPPARPTPSSPPIDCTGSDTQTDARNCGACGNVCSAKAPSTARCTLGRCLVTLATGGVYADFVVGASNVYWTNWGGSALMKLSKGGGQPVELTSVAGAANGLAIDATHLYWTTYDLDGTVAKASLEGGRPTTLARNQIFPQNVAVHATGVYWSTWASYGANGTVTKLAAGGGTPTILATGQDHPGAIGFDATDIYWSSGGKVMRMPIAGGQVTTFLTGVYGRPVVSGGSVYYCQYEEGADTGTVMKVPTGGGTPTVLASARPAGLAVDGDSVYWTEVDPSGGNPGAVMKVPVSGGSPTVLASGLDGPDRIVVDETSVYLTNYNSSDNGGGMSLMRITPK